MLEVENISVSYGTVPVLRNVSLQAETGEIVCLLGASGSGKTTLLRVIAGLQAFQEGSITFNGQDLNGQEVYQRRFGYMFQDFALFPHLSVGDNIAFGLRMQGWSRQAIQNRVDEILKQVGLAGYAMRDVSQLSGGEKQRVALARSLAPGPSLMLLDEPLGSLDASLRTQLVGELRTLLKASHVTALYVTHDQEEAFVIADRVAIMHKHRIAQLATAREVFMRPASSFIANFLNLQNIFDLTDHKMLAGLQNAGIVGRDVIPDAVAICIHPAGIRPAVTEQGMISDQTVQLQAIVSASQYKGLLTRLDVITQHDLSLTCYVQKDVFETGQTLSLTIDPNAILFLST